MKKIFLFLLFIVFVLFNACKKENKQITKDDLNIAGEITLDGTDYFIIKRSTGLKNSYFPIPKGVISKARIKYYDQNDDYRGDTPIDSVIVKKNSITAWNNGEIVYVNVQTK